MADDASAVGGPRGLRGPGMRGRGGFRGGFSVWRPETRPGKRPWSLQKQEVPGIVLGTGNSVENEILALLEFVFS